MNADDDADSKDAIRERILGAAERLVVHYGYDKTTIDDIAREAGISKSTLYLRWKKKDDLMSALFWRASRRFVENWFVMVEDDPGGGTYSGMFRTILMALHDDPVMMAMFIDNRKIMGNFINRPEMAHLFTQRSQTDVVFMRSLQEAGVVRKDINLEVTVFLLSAMRYGIVRLIDETPGENKPSLDDVMEVMSDMIARYVEPEGGGDSEAGKVVLREMKAHYMAMLESMEAKFPNMY